MSGNFPKMLFKRGDEMTIFEKLKVDTLIVNDEEELAEALGDGFTDDAIALNKLQYQEGGDPPTAEGGYPADHQWDKGLMAQAGRADRFEGLEKAAEVKAEADAKVSLPLGNPPRHLDPSVPGPAAETEGADALKKKPGEHTKKAEEEFAAQAEAEAEKAEAKRGPGRPPKAASEEGKK